MPCETVLVKFKIFPLRLLSGDHPRLKKHKKKKLVPSINASRSGKRRSQLRGSK
jgi:hypothetical protein